MQSWKFAQWTALVGLSCLLAACRKPAEESVDTPTEVAPQVSPMETVAAPAVEKSALETVDQLASYGIGYGTGASLTREGVIDVDQDALIEGLLDGLASVDPQVDEATLRTVFAELDQRVQSRADARVEANLATARAFLAKNAQRAGVTVTGSGLQYAVLATGGDAGARKPNASDTVEVHYHGTLTDGTVFDSSVRRGKPLTIPVAGVIPGWVEALKMMSVGDQWKIYLPPALGYGSSPTGSIPGNSALVFEIQLLSVVGAGEADGSGE